MEKFRRKPKRDKGNFSGEQLTEFRRNNDLSMQEVANFLGVSTSTVWGWEIKGRTPRNRNLAELACILPQLEQG